MSKNVFFIAIVGLGLAACSSCNTTPKTDDTNKPTEPTQLNYTITNTYPHNINNFTEGLEFIDGFLYEGTGDPDKKGTSKISKTELTTGKDVQKTMLSKDFFGEGITVLNSKIYQLTYKEQKCFVYDAKTFAKIKEYNYEGEGWGLTNNGTQLIMSNGGSNLAFRNSETFAIEKTVTVSNNYGALPNINELEFVDGFIYANIWQLHKIVKIDITLGKVVAEINFDDLLKKYPPENEVDVLNGIAYDKVGKRFFITGKYYPKVFEIKFN